MAVEFWAGVVLFKGGQVAMAEDCCCTPTPTPTPTPSPTFPPGAKVCLYTWQVTWNCTYGVYSAPVQVDVQCVEDCQGEDFPWEYGGMLEPLCYYNKGVCEHVCTGEGAGDCPSGTAPTDLPHGGAAPPHIECGCVPTLPPPGCYCKHTWECVWNCSAQAWGSVTKISTECVDECVPDADWAFNWQFGDECGYQIITCEDNCDCP